MGGRAGASSMRAGHCVEQQSASRSRIPPRIDGRRGTATWERPACKVVADLQDAQKRAGFTASDRAGVFSGNTADAVRKFQSQHGLPATGGGRPDDLEALKL
jgi:murein L,D-transpeptidase YcbB/YkuD